MKEVFVIKVLTGNNSHYISELTDLTENSIVFTHIIHEAQTFLTYSNAASEIVELSDKMNVATAFYQIDKLFTKI